MPAIDFKALFNEERERRRKQQQQQVQQDLEHPAGGPGEGVGGGGCVGRDARATHPAPMPACELSPRAPMRLADYEIATQFGVSGLHYVPDFITVEEERRVLRGVYAQGTDQRWVTCGRRRVQNWGGRPGDATVTENLPPFATSLVHAVVSAGICDDTNAPNHVLVNEYSAPAGIAPHNDGDLYAPHVAIITLSGSALMDFWPAEGPAVVGWRATGVALPYSKRKAKKRMLLDAVRANGAKT